MRPLIPLLLIALPIACASSKLEKGTADRLIKPDYPAPLLVRVPQKATVEKGSDKAARVKRINELLAKENWFVVKEEDQGGKLRYTYSISPKAPSTVKSGMDNFEAPAAMAEFAGSVRMEPMDTRRGGGPVKVTFLVRFSKPTGLWPLYEFLHPGARLGQPVERHAIFERSGGKWGLTKTDETAKINE